MSWTFPVWCFSDTINLIYFPQTKQVVTCLNSSCRHRHLRSLFQVYSDTFLSFLTLFFSPCNNRKTIRIRFNIQSCRDEWTLLMIDSSVWVSAFLSFHYYLFFHPYSCLLLFSSLPSSLHTSFLLSFPPYILKNVHKDYICKDESIRCQLWN